MMGNVRCLLFYTLICFAALTASTVLAGEPPMKEKPLTANFLTPCELQDYSTPDLRTFDESALGKYQSNSDYQYDRAPEKPSYISRFFEWLTELLKEILPETGVDTTFDLLKYVLIALMIAILVSMLMNVPLNSLFLRRSARPIAPAYETIDENIHELDFDLLITEAVSQQDYRKAVRLNYLKTLKLLSDREVIAWESNKTNQDYQSELKRSPFYQPFTNITRAFNYVWYGNFSLNSQQYLAISQAFEQFGSTIQTAKR